MVPVILNALFLSFRAKREILVGQPRFLNRRLLRSFETGAFEMTSYASSGYRKKHLFPWVNVKDALSGIHVIGVIVRGAAHHI